MRSRLILLTVLAFITALLAFRIKEATTVKFSVVAKRNPVTRNIIGCTPDWNELKEWLEETDIPPIPGAGSYKWKISTKNDSAQFYFNQGINMYYSFHIIEAMASFKKASKFDPNCAMLEWAKALAYGPNINDIGYAASKDALTAIENAKMQMDIAPGFEKMLIYAQIARYSTDSTVSREKLNQAYVDKMKEVYESYPTDADAAALYADALMLQHPWDLWRNDGTPKPWTPLIRTVLEKLLQKTPNHPGANHYYIHVMEPSPYAAKAIPSADRLGKLTPGLSHTVHMPSHIYLRTGNYSKGVSINETAVNSYKKTIPLYAPVTSNDFLYIIHNLHMKTNHAMLAGNFKVAEAAAFETRNSIQIDYLSIPAPMGSYVQYIYMTPVLVYVRFGKWNELLQMIQPENVQVYANVLYRYGRGMALANQYRFAEAKFELEQMQQLMKDSALAIPFSPFSSSFEGAVVAEKLLTGTIALKEKRMTDAVVALEKAVATEENMVYNEPRDWLLNPKHYLANVFLVIGNGEKAEEVLKRDLLNNNENGWALFGLYQSLLLQKKTSEAGKVLIRFKKSFEKADIKLSRPVF